MGPRGEYTNFSAAMLLSGFRGAPHPHVGGSDSATQRPGAKPIGTFGPYNGWAGVREGPNPILIYVGPAGDRRPQARPLRGAGYGGPVF